MRHELITGGGRACGDRSGSLAACLAAAPVTVLAVVSVTSPASSHDNGVGLAPELWSHRRTKITGTISAEVPARGVALFLVGLGV